MSLQQRPPGKGGGERLPHFVHVKTAHGERWHAYCAGPCHWFDCHTKGRTKPCLHAISGGALACDRCNPLQPAEVIGYQPLFREMDSKPCFVVVHETTREIVDTLPHFSRVVVGRGEDQSDGVFVCRSLNPEPRFTTVVAWKMRAIDLTESLLRVWGLPELLEWYRRTHKASDSPLSLPQTAPLKSDGEEFSPMLQAAAKRYGSAPASEDDPSGVFGASLNRLKDRVEKNGKHVPKKG